MTSSSPVTPRPTALRLLTALIAAIAAIVLPISLTGAALAPASDHHWQHTTWTVQVGNQSRDQAIQGMRYLPSNIWVHAGDTVRWQANSAEIHTVTFLATGQALQPFNPTDPMQTTVQGGHSYDGTSYYSSGVLSTDPRPVLGMTTVRDYALSFPHPGDYTYWCLVHGAVMKGTVHVRARTRHLPYTQAQYDQQVVRQGHAILADGYHLWEETREQATRHLVLMGNDDGTAMVMRFVRPTVTIRAGQSVSFANIGMGAPHTVTFGTEPLNVTAPSGDPSQYRGGNLNSGIQIPGATFQVRFLKPGVYHYICALHDTMGMVGTVVVLRPHHD
jgi:plastocyanin